MVRIHTVYSAKVFVHLSAAKRRRAGSGGVASWARLLSLSHDFKTLGTRAYFNLIGLERESLSSESISVGRPRASNAYERGFMVFLAARLRP